MRCTLVLALVVSSVAGLAACGDEPIEADRLGVGASCAADSDCSEPDQRCLTQFKGGYCGVAGCAGDGDCPEAASCVTHDDGSNYCFRVCEEKPECNAHRLSDEESNCASSVTFVDEGTGRKACVPPSGS